MARGWRNGAACVFLGAVALANGGCVALVAGAAAAGGATGYFYYKGEVGRVYAADLDTVWAATKAALADLKMPVKAEKRTGLDGRIESGTTSDRVEITFDAKKMGDGATTRVGVRVATFGDEDVSHRLLDQIGYRLAPPPAAPPSPTLTPVAAPAPVTLSRPAESAPPPLAAPGR